jgi:hypothetical protein
LLTAQVTLGNRFTFATRNWSYVNQCHSVTYIGSKPDLGIAAILSATETRMMIKK